MSKKEENKHDELENVQNALTSTEAFIEKYQKQILFAVGAVVLIVLAILAFRNFYLEPREVAAQNEMYKSQASFATDSFKIALEGDNKGAIGFKEIVSEYGITASGKLAAAYAGICYYKMGQYEDAVKYLSQYDGDDTYFSASVIGLTGDCYVELNETSKALSYFEKAADLKNEVMSPIYLKKAGLVYESLKETDKAEKAYTTIKEKYPNINYLGVLQQHELAKVYAAADVFVFPSKTDTFGLVLLEAMACGTPVAAYPVTGPIDVLGKSPAGAMNEDLRVACLQALKIPREVARCHAEKFSWRAASEQFVSHLKPVPSPEVHVTALA
jgi:tetratricopeptide (TPR) repeat protein